MFQYIFKRYEKKYVLTGGQFEMIIKDIEKHTNPDEYGMQTVCSMYYDTNKYDLNRFSLEKPEYKEKFRLRSYGVPDDDTCIFAELKKKCDGIVYKRRLGGTTKEIFDFIDNRKGLDGDIYTRMEMSCFLDRYKVYPKIGIFCERFAVCGKNPGEEDLRITFDWNLRSREENPDMRLGDYGDPIVPDGTVIMEVKTPLAAPLWLADILSKNKIYPGSFSKVGTSYVNNVLKREFSKAG